MSKNAVSEETHHKMSKKIAQLTKVIFQLHSENQENSIVHASLGNVHEKEMEIVLKQANEIINRQKDELAKAKEGAEFKEKIRKLESDHLKERKDAQAELVAFKRAHEE